jgi:PAS domain S-box-containing protein
MFKDDVVAAGRAEVVHLPGEWCQSILDALPAATYICDALGMVIACNRAALELYGAELPRGIRDESLLLQTRKDGAESAATTLPFDTVLGGGEAICGMDVVIDTAQGDTLNAQVGLRPLRVGNGAVFGVLVEIHPVGSRDDLEDLFENGSIGLHFVAADGTILRANQAELDLLGYRRDEYVGRHISEFHAEADVIADILTRLGAGETLDKYPARLIARDGQIKHVQISSSARFQSGRLIHTRCFTVDVTEQHQLAQATHEREKLSHQLLEALPVAIYTTDALGRITFYNQATVAFAGRTPAVGEEWCVSWKMFQVDGTPLPHEQCPMAVAIREQRPIHGAEAVAERPDGSRVAFAAYPTPLFDEAGVMVGAVNMLVDVTEHQKIERALQDFNDTLERRVHERTREAEAVYQDLHRSERNFALLVGSIVDYAVYMLDPQGNITNWNRGAERIKGYLAKEIVGQNFSRFYTPEDRAQNLPARALATALREGKYEAEGWRVRKDGSRFWASVVIDPIFDQGSLIGFAKITRDVTERRKNETALIESERQSRGVIDTALDGFAQLDEAGLVLEWNPRAQTVFGWTREEAVGRRLIDLVVAQEDRARFAEYLPPTLRSALSPSGGGQIEAVTREGKKLIVELSISVLVMNDGMRFNVFMRDLTEKVLIEGQLRQAQKMEAVGQLTGGIAHDFNNLLQGIIGSLDLIQLRINAGRSENIGRFVEGALTSANRAAALTHRLLAFSRQQPLDPRPIDVNPLLTSMEDLLRRTMGEQIQLEFELAADLWSTLCDPNQLESALLNLSINARDAMSAGGRLTIRSHNADIDPTKAGTLRDVACGQYICIDVMDTGSGMPQEIVERAFDPFFTTKPAGQGTGLGLSMVYGFARQSNGQCEIRSKPGLGTTIRLYLPRHSAEIQAAPPVPASHSPAGKGEVVLVVEDEPVVRKIVLEVLDQLGYQSIEAASGEAGLEVLGSGQAIDLLISDIGLPGLNGRLLADAAKQLHPGIKVLLMTGYASGAATAAGFLAPGMELITKPFTVQALALRIREMIENTEHGILTRRYRQSFNVDR